MKVYAISDLHLSGGNPKPMDIFGQVWENYLDEIEDSIKDLSGDDVLLLAGDLSWAMNMSDVRKDIEYLGSYKCKKVIIRGNHDYWWSSISAVRNILPSGMYAVQNDAVRIENLVVCGSRGWTTPETAFMSPEDKKIYDREIIRISLSLDAMEKIRKPDDKVVAMIHYPPFNSRYERTPFTKLFSQHKVDAVVYGHLHGKSVRVNTQRIVDGVPYFLTSCDLLINHAQKIFEI